MRFQRTAIGIGLAALLVLVALGTPTVAASATESTTNTAPVVGALDGASVLDGPAHHCGPNESHVDPFYCIYNPPCDGTCVEVESTGGAFMR